MQNNVHIIGCSPQALYVADIALLLKMTIAGIYDPVGQKVDSFIEGYKVQPFSHYENLLIRHEQELATVICLKDNKLKDSLFERLKPEVNFINFIHPASHVAQSAILGDGNIINAGVVIQPRAEIRNGCMIHAGVVVDHDCLIGDFVNIAPGVVLAGGVCVGERTTISAGSVIKPGVRIGRDCLVGAGSLLLEDVPDNVVVYGSPAATVRQYNI